MAKFRNKPVVIEAVRWRGHSSGLGITSESMKPESMTRAELERQLERANRLIGWMMPYIGSMCPPSNGLYDLNSHCFENHVPEPGDETKGASIRQHAAGARPSGVR